MATNVLEARGGSLIPPAAQRGYHIFYRDDRPTIAPVAAAPIGMSAACSPNAPFARRRCRSKTRISSRAGRSCAPCAAHPSPIRRTRTPLT